MQVAYAKKYIVSVWNLESQFLLVIHLNINSNCFSGISAHEGFLGRAVFKGKAFNWGGKVVNFLERGVVANDKGK